MNMIEFSQMIPSEQLAAIFKNFFEQHIATYNLLKGIQFGGINVITNDMSSIIYSVKLLNDEDKDLLVRRLNNLKLKVYNDIYTPSVYVNNDLLCITITKDK